MILSRLFAFELIALIARVLIPARCILCQEWMLSCLFAWCRQFQGGESSPAKNDDMGRDSRFLVISFFWFSSPGILSFSDFSDEPFGKKWKLFDFSSFSSLFSFSCELLYLRVENLTLFSPSFSSMSWQHRKNRGKFHFLHFSFFILEENKKRARERGEIPRYLHPGLPRAAPPWQGTEERGAGGMKGRERWKARAIP